MPDVCSSHPIADRMRWYDSTLVLGLLSAILMWLAVPPVDMGQLGWIAPVGWLLLVKRAHLTGWRPYVVLYGVGWLYFGASSFWIMVPHLIAVVGLIAVRTDLGV